VDDPKVIFHQLLLRALGIQGGIFCACTGRKQEVLDIKETEDIVLSLESL
jgi:hypothetical protein